MIGHILVGFLMLSISFPLYTQSPQIISVSPPNQRIDAARSTEITMQFDTPMAPAGFNDTTFQVFGRWSGVAGGDFTFTDDNTVLTFHPARPFFAGEWVAVQLSRHLRSIEGEEMGRGYAWGFWTACSQGTLQQTFVETIVLRESGEGLIQTYGAHAGDLNGDGMSDLIAINETADDIRISLNDGTGRYAGLEIIPLGDSRPSPSDGGDFNKDGHPDLAIGSVSDDVLRVCYGDGEGSFGHIAELTADEAVRAVAVGDFNGDGWDDIVTANRVASNMTIFLNQGDSTFAKTTFEAGGDGETSCVATDANGDGIPDLFVGMLFSHEICVLLGDGEGGFATSGCSPVSGGPWMIAAGDMNGDGHADVVSANLNGDAVSVVPGDGEGGLGDETPYFFGAHAGPLAIDLGDLDADGDLDAVASYYSSQSYVVFDNDGTGTFGIGDALSPAESGTARSSCAILHDRDNDGDLDITLTDEGDDVVYLYENNDEVSTPSFRPEKFDISISPIPANDRVSIAFTLPNPVRIRIEALASNGASAGIIADRNFGVGLNVIEWDTAALPTGMYYVQFALEGSEAFYEVVIFGKG